jgi:6-phosphogluconolactonase
VVSGPRAGAAPVRGDAVSRRAFLGAAAAAAGGAAVAGCAPGAPAAAGLVPNARRADAGPLVYVGTYTAPGRAEGVYAFRADPGTGAWRPAGAYDAGPNPSFLAAHPRGRVLYAVNEVERVGAAESGQVRALAAGAGGALTALGTPRLTGGGAPCYVSVLAAGGAGDSVLVANYVGGSVNRLMLGPGGAVFEADPAVRHTGRGPRADRQDAPHAHCILPDPSGRWAVAADLGTDQVLVYRFDVPGLASAGAFAMPPGAGPRHLAFAPGGRVLYVVGELDHTLTALRFDPATGALAAGPRVALVGDAGAPAGERTAAHVAVARSGRVVYASVRGDDVLVVLHADPATGALRVVQRVPTGGRWPRHFALDPAGQFLHVANQRSDTVTRFAVDAASGRLAPSGDPVGVPSPTCVCWMSGP